jgi:DNA-binding transcriptional ArsR family regulator
MAVMPTTTKPEKSAERANRLHHPDVAALDLAVIMRTLGDPLRLEMIRLIGEVGESPCGELSDRLGIPASTASYHMRLLREAGLTRKRALGTQHLISLRREDLESRFPGLVELITAPPK